MDSNFIDQLLANGTIIEISEHTLLVGYGTRQWHEKQPQSTAFYLPDFFLENQKPWCVHAHYQIVDSDWLLNQLSGLSTPLSIEWESISPDFFFDQFKQLQEDYFQSQILSKAVPYVRQSAKKKIDKLTIASFLKSSLEFRKIQKGYLHGFWDNEEGMLGVTPELLFTYFNHTKQIETMACAGTATNQPFTDKDHDEHQLVVQGIKEALEPYFSLTIKSVKELQFGHLKHLVTPIKGEQKKACSFEDLVKMLHPTPALGTYPKSAGMQWLKDYDQQLPRLRYGAPVGYQLQDRSACLVGIRNMQWNTTELYLFAGCGVLPASSAVKEWEELDNKFKAIKTLFGI